MKRIQIIAVSALLAQATICWASEGILTYTPNDTTVVTGFAGNGIAGWSFQPTTAISVTSLGVFDDVITGQSPLTVGLWTQTGSLLASATVTSSDPLVNQTVYQSITPVTLTAGVTYLLGAYSLDGSVYIPVVNPPGGSVMTSPEIQLGAAIWSTNGISTFPDTTVGPPGSAILAPNFEFSDVPEPSVEAFSAVGGAILVWQGVRRTQKRRNGKQFCLGTEEPEVLARRLLRPR
jgi:hypothetical protein